MRTRTLAGIMSAAVVAGLVVIPAAAANAATPSARPKTAGSTVWLRQADFIPALSDTRSSGHLQFIPDGLHLWTDDNSSQAKVAEYWPVAGSLADMDGSALTWWGTSPAPGAQIVFSADGNLDPTSANFYNILVGEPDFYGDDWWLTNGSSAMAKGVCPSTTGGFGSACHGTLAQWATALPNAKVYAGGFSLGSGVLGNGLLYAATYGNTTYHFTNSAPVLSSTMMLSPRVVTLGGLVTATGRLTQDGFAAPGKLVTFWRQSGKSWVQFGATRSGLDGRWAKALIPPATWTIQARSAGFPTATAVVTVTSRVQVKAIGRTVYVGVVPNLAGKQVVLQIQSGKIWLHVTSAYLSKYSTAAFRVSKPGVYHVIALAVPGYAPGVSVPVTVK